ncbi:acyl-CoA synthetase [Hippea jasoniae]|uniref:acyl-CoA synthetase n=1 Tax=Hippea jasoniae TaxID=944479 RepID=UPI0005557DB3|nr:AMP-binding protein [Hippea jasoniae]
MNKDVEKFMEMRDFLLNVKSYEEAKKGFEWPEVDEFNWALDFFDPMAKDNNRQALIWADEEGCSKIMTFDELRRKSNQVANMLEDLGLQKGDRVFIIVEAIPEVHELTLALMKTGGVFIPGATILPAKDISDRILRGNVKFLITQDRYIEKMEHVSKEALSNLKALINIGTIEKEGWVNYKNYKKYSEEYSPKSPTKASDECYLFFTSGTTAKPKLVIHTHSYPIGHLTTMYWINAKKDDIHYNISAPGWAKYAWSTIFAPWNAEAIIFVFKYEKFEAKKVLRAMEKFGVTSLCAPLSVLKLLTLEDLELYDLKLRNVVSAGEPLIPEVVKKVEKALGGIQIREGYGQTETTALIGNFPGEPRKDLSFGKPAPGFEIALLDENFQPVKPGEDGQICVRIQPKKPLGLLAKYDDEEVNNRVFHGEWYQTSDSAYYDEDGYYFFVGRTDDVFKSLDYRISPFEVESEISEHPAVLEVGVVPTVDERERIVPKAFIVLKPDYRPSKEVALDIFKFIRENMAPYKRPRVIEFLQEFPKTISAKIMRRELRAYEEEKHKAEAQQGMYEFWESDFKDELDLGKRKI